MNESKLRRASLALSGDVLTESLSMIRTIKMFSREIDQLLMFDATMLDADKINNREFRFSAAFDFFFSVFQQFVFCAVLWLALIHSPGTNQPCPLQD